MLMKTIPVGPLACNCTIIADETTRDAVVIDPGDDVHTIMPLLEKQKLTVRAMLHTHAHLDHICGTRPLKEATQASIMLHRGDAWLYENLPMQASLFGWEQQTPLPVDEWVEHGQTVRCGSLAIDVIHTPGHTPGSICFHLKEQGILFSGDTLFRESIGRTDLWGGSYEEIMESITGRLMALDDQTRVICGHGPETNIGAERRKNPFILQHERGE